MMRTAMAVTMLVSAAAVSAAQAAHVTVVRGDTVLLQRGYGSTVLDDPKGPALTARTCGWRST